MISWTSDHTDPKPSGPAVKVVFQPNKYLISLATKVLLNSELQDSNLAIYLSHHHLTGVQLELPLTFPRFTRSSLLMSSRSPPMTDGAALALKRILNTPQNIIDDMCHTMLHHPAMLTGQSCSQETMFSIKLPPYL